MRGGRGLRLGRRVGLLAVVVALAAGSSVDPTLAAAAGRPVPALAGAGRTAPQQQLPPPVKPQVAAPADTSAGAAVYAYDAAHRLVGVTHPNGATAQYSYDPAGNVTGIQQFPSSQLSVLSVVPPSARPGEAITIHGTGFSPVASADVVSFNGTAAQVTAASANTLTVTVPSGVSAGPLTVTVAGTTAQGGTFTPTAVPVIASFSPKQGPPTTVVTVSGSGFSPVASDDIVTVNGVRAQVTAASATSLTFIAPLSGTGRVQVTTPGGQSTSTTDFTTQVSTANLAPIDSVTAMTMDGPSQDVTIGTAGRSALVRFFTPDGQLSAALTNSTLGNLNVAVYDAAGTAVKSVPATVTGDDTVISQLPAGQSYQLLITPVSAGATGRVTVTLSSAAWSGALSATGPGIPLAIDRPGLMVGTSFSGVKNSIVSVGLTGSTFRTAVSCWVGSATAPAGQVGGGSAPAGSADSFLAVLPDDGVYYLRCRAAGAATGKVTATLSVVPQTAVSATGPGAAVKLTRPGQYQLLIVPATTTSSFAIGLTGNTFPDNLNYQVYSPDGSLLDEGGAFLPNTDGSFTEFPTSDGNHLVLLWGEHAVTGSVTATLSNPVTGTLVAGAAPVTKTAARPGQDIFLAFAGTKGGSLRINLTNSTFPDTLYYGLGAPDGTSPPPGGGQVAPGGSATIKLTNLPVTGTYVIALGGGHATTGSITVALTAGAATAGVDSADRVALGKAAVAVRDRRGAPKTSTRTGMVGPQEMRALANSATSVQRSAQSPTTTAADGQPLAGEIPAEGGGSWQPDGANQRGIDWLIRRGAGTPIDPLRAAAGTTAVSGVVRTLDDKPLPGVTLRIGTASTRSDAQGRFLLEGVGTGDQTLDVDGATASSQGRRYGFYSAHLSTTRGATLVLPYTIWMTQLDTEHMVRLSSPTARETVLTTPKIPGLEVHIPAGSVIKDKAGRIVRELGITPIPLDRAPFPLPDNGIVPVFFTVQPGGTYVLPAGAWIVYPNYTHLPAGKRVDFWDYDPTQKGWHVYGHGQVSADAQQVVPDKDTRVWAFFGAMFNTSNPAVQPYPARAGLPAANAAPPQVGGSGPPAQPAEPSHKAGDPVDLTTGQQVDASTDLAENDVVPITLTRMYNGGDTGARGFGIGAAGSYDSFLYSRHQYSEVDLYVPGGGVVHYTRTSPGTSFHDAVFAATATTGPYRGSVISWVPRGDGWTLALRDGTTVRYPDYARATSISDRNGNTITLGRDVNGNLTQITSPNGRWIKLAYDTSNRATKAWDAIGRTVTYAYDNAGRLTTVTDPTGKTLNYGYDASSGKLTSAKDTRGITYVSNSYDTSGRISRQATTDGQIYTFAYTADATGKITETRVTQPDKSVRRVTFDGKGAITSDTAAYGTTLARVTTYTRGPTGRIDQVTDPHGRTIAHRYDTDGRLTHTTVTPTGGGAVDGPKTAWGAFDLPAQVTDQLGNTTSYGRDGRGNLTKITDPLGRTVTIAYNAAGQPLTVLDPAGKTTAYGYANGDPVTVTDPLGATARQFVDAAGRTTATTDPTGATTTLTRDARDRITQTVDPLGHIVKSGYDATGNLISLANQNGKTRTWSYDNSNRIAKITNPLGHAATRTYDATGRLTKTTDAAGKVTQFGYDALNRTTKIEYGVPPIVGQPESTVTVAYSTTNSQIAQITDTAAGGPTSYAYDALDRVTQVAQPTGTITYGYDAANRRTTMTIGATTTAYTYDRSGALTGVAQGGTSATPRYDNAGRRDRVALPGGWAQNYSFDAAGRTTAIAYTHNSTAKGGLAYTYDPDGQITAVTGDNANITLPPTTAGLTYDAADRLTNRAGATLTYDPNGNLTNDGTTAYTYNSRGQLTGLSGPTAASFRYTATGTRDRTTVGGTTTGTLNDGPNPAAETDANGTITATLLSGGLDAWLARTASGRTHTYLTDLQGSTLALGAGDGSRAASYAYDPYGKPSVTSGAAGGNTFSYTGRQDDQTGLLYYRSRYYSPTLGRFTSADSAGLAGGVNPYSYTLDNPTNYVDPFGYSGRNSDEFDRNTFYHGSDIESLVDILNNGLDAEKAAGKYTDGPGGFFVATRYDDAVFFGTRLGRGGVVKVQMSDDALDQLRAAGAVRRPIPMGPKSPFFKGDEIMIPKSAFDLFNQLMRCGAISVSP